MNKDESRPVVVIVTPAWADANNGNWQTAQRWARHLAAKHTVLLTDRWPDGPTLAVTPRGTRAQPSLNGSVTQAQAQSLGQSQRQAHALLALHARRSAASIRAWHQSHGSRGLAVVLTGTDLYKDLHSADPAMSEPVRQSLLAAHTLVVLQDQAPQALPTDQQAKAHVIFQSCSARKTLTKPDPARRPLRAVMVGHLREEKDPQTLQRGAALLANAGAGWPPILIDHLGAALSPEFEQAAQATQAACPHYRWLDACSHEQTRRRIQRAHVLVHTSRLEGGAHVIMEAVRSGTAVIASRMDGNVGMLGADYAGYFDVGDAQGLASALHRLQRDPHFLPLLTQQCAQRAALFDPAHEAQQLQGLVGELTRR